MRYLKGSRWPYNRALRADTHSQTHRLTELIRRRRLVWCCGGVIKHRLLLSDLPSHVFFFVLSSSSASLRLQIKRSPVSSGLLCDVRRVQKHIYKRVGKLCACDAGESTEGVQVQKSVGQVGELCLHRGLMISGSSNPWFCFYPHHPPHTRPSLCEQALRWESETAYGHYASSPAFTQWTSSLYSHTVTLEFNT